MVADAVADFVGSATLTARMLTVDGEGTVPGAVYKPVDEIVPTLEFPPLIPFTCQVTLVSAVFSTVAVNCTVCRVRTVAVEGDTATETGRLLMTEIVYELEAWPSGFRTVTGTLPRVEVEPVADSWDEELYAVLSAVPPSFTTAPF